MNIELGTDIWDDTLVIKAYEDSIQTAKEQVAKRIAMSTNVRKNSEVSDELSTNGDSTTFKLNDYVRATFSDGIDYEAQIIGIKDDKYLIKYIGYENEEYVHGKDLVASWGNEFRRLQIQDAKTAAADEEQDNVEAKAQKHSKSKSENDILRKKYKSNSYMKSNPAIVIPPPPPMPPGIFDESEDSEHLSAMLMSWYMSGYYTGLYQGQKLAQKHKK